MILVPAAVPRTAPAFRRLIDPFHLPSVHGGLTVETLPPGVRVEQHPSRVAESVTVVLSGRIRSAGRVLGPGEGLYHPPGSSCGITALPGAPAAVLTVRPRAVADDRPAPLPYPVPLGPPRPTAPDAPTAPATPAAGTVPAARRAGEAGPSGEAGPVQPEPGAAGRIAGSAGMEVRWLATADTVGARRLTVAASTFAVGGGHDLHRHPHADEFFLVMSGGGGHLTETAEVPLRAGDLVFVPAGEWHGFRTGPAGPTAALYGYLGASSLTGAGYQVRPADVPEVA
ncbi:cupin domain-containing protein [Streptomyces sp. BE303]|uniref:cupin domain-containing protein n=1 Tax=Streptomyces sp. BE303 TaxID=3002528 RepID=UPI002E76A9CF|nr:cupin domain-containing protein [Streptomyces sp. BE303]MED7949890.1 cupin domain-containing protein [Streptomyces sp. BE303]